jgi:TonB-linked SusC/RagA family outer membrane protein
MHLPCLRRLAGAALLLCAALGADTEARAQNTPYTLQGTAVDAATQQPLANVTVQLRRTGQATGPQTVTNASGQFTLQANVTPGSYTLQFSLLGRGQATRPITLGAEPSVQIGTVALQPRALELEGLVVTGTGVTARRLEVANTVESVRGEEISEAPGASTVDQALQGKVTGAVISENSGQPGGGVSIRLRGTSTILGGGEPLIVVDGIIVDNNDAALVSLGANAGRGSAALTNRLADIAPGDIDRIEILKGAAAAALYGSRANNGVIQIFTKKGQPGAPQITFRTETSVNRTPGRYDLLTYPFAGPADAAFVRTTRTGEQIVAGQPVERFDIQDQLFRTGSGFNNQISVSGGSEGTQYYVSGVYNTEDGIVRSTDYEKKSARVSLTQRITDKLQVVANANFVQTETNLVPEGEQTEGALTNIIFQPTSFNPAFDPEQNRFPYSFLGANPLDILTNWRAPEDVTRFFGSVETSWSPVDNVSLRYFFGIDDYRQESQFLRPPRSTSARDVGIIQNPVRFSRQLNSEFTATHDAPLTATVGLNTTAGFRYTSDRGEVISSTASDLPPFQTTVGGANLSTSQGITEIRTVGGFIQERLAFNDRLFLTGGLNYEGSSAFGENERFQFFPRLGASWVVDDEPFWSGSRAGDFVSTLRLRAAYGQTGGQPPSAYGRFDNFFNLAFAGQPGLLPSSVAGNPNVRPERQVEYEGGFDAGFLNDRVLVEFTYYDQTTDNLVLSVPLPLSSGFSSQLQNIGEITNRGVEIALNTQNLQNRNLSWTSRLQYSANRNKVERLVTDADTLVTGYLNAVVEGQPVGVFYGRGYERNAQGEIVIDPRTGLGARSSQFKIIGDPNPDFTASLTNTVTIRDNLRFNMLLDGRFGNDVANFTRRITEFFGSDAIVQQEIEAIRAKQQDSTVVVPKYSVNGGRISNYEEYVEDGSFVKLREIALSYSFAQPWVQRFGASSIDLRIAGRNLYTWTDYSGLDPEINLFANNTVARGVDFAVTPIPRQFILGATFNF